MRRNIFFVAIFILNFSSALIAQDVRKANVQTHLKTLSSDEFLGRGTGEKGEALAAEYISQYFKKLKLQPWGDEGTYYQNFSFKFRKTSMANPHGSGEYVPKTGKNVVAYLDNGADYTIIIGAHYDHLGTGLLGSSRDANPEGKIHNGADDNASGTAGVMELARYYVENDVKEKCNFIFIAFSGEELGLVGSKKFTQFEKFDSSKIQCMVNMDMIGRLNDSTKKILVYGIGTSPVFGAMVEKFKPEAADIKVDSSGTGPTDHTSFYLKDIPVLSFFTGQHQEYHKPEDDEHLINYEGEIMVLKYVANIIDSVATMPKIKFTKTKNKDKGRVSFKVTLGVMPDYTFEGPGLKIDGVTEGKTAAKAGVKTGDIIVAMGDMDIADIRDYMKVLSKHEKGDKIIIKVKRGEELVDLNAVF